MKQVSDEGKCQMNGTLKSRVSLMGALSNIDHPF